MRRPSISEGSRLHHLPLVVETLDKVVAPTISGIRRARAERTPGEPASATFKRMVRNTAVPVSLGVAMIGGCLFLERSSVGESLLRSTVLQRSWLNRFDLVQLGAGAVHGLTIGAIEGFKPEALGLAPAQGPKAARAAKTALRHAGKNLLGDTAQLAVFKGLGIGIQPSP